MTEEASNGTQQAAEVGAATEGTQGTQQSGNPGDKGKNGGKGGSPAAPIKPGDMDAIYETAFQKFLAPQSSQTQTQTDGNPDGDADAEGEGGGEGAAADDDQAGAGAGGGDETPTLTDDQIQLLKRNHVSPEMVAGWTDEQRQEFIGNLEKRETDNTRTFKDLRDRLQKLEEAAGSGGKPNGEKPGEQAGGEGQTLTEQIAATVEDLQKVYGDEIKPLGSLMQNLGTQLEAAQQRAAGVPILQELLVEMTLDSGIRDLVSDFPTLNKADARQKVIDRFEKDWPNSPHRTAKGKMLNRIKSAIADAAKAEFGTQTESAAQVALANKTKERLRNQPNPGNGRGRAVPKTEEDVYDAAFQEHIQPELNR